MRAINEKWKNLVKEMEQLRKSKKGKSKIIGIWEFLEIPETKAGKK